MEASTMNPDQTTPLIWVHIVCNINYIRTTVNERSRHKVVTGGKRFFFSNFYGYNWMENSTCQELV